MDCHTVFDYPPEKSFLWILNFPTLPNDNFANSKPACYLIFTNLSLIAYANEFQKSKFGKIQVRICVPLMHIFRS